MDRTIRPLLATVLGACLLAAGTTAVSADEQTPPPWFGGRVEMPAFALTVPDDWVAVDLDGDLHGQANAIAEWLYQDLGLCATPSCEAGIRRSLQDEERTVRLLAMRLPDDGASGLPYQADKCQVHGPGSVGDRRLGEIAGIMHDVHERNEDVDVLDVPRALPADAGPGYAFDIIALGGRIVGTVYVFGGAGEFAWMGCSAGAAPEDRWLSIAETFEFLSQDAPAPSASPPSASDTSARAAPDLQAMLPVWVGDHGLLSYSERGLGYLREWSRIPDEQLRELEADPGALDDLLPPGIELDDIEFANAGRANVQDPPYFATAFRVRGLPAEMLPLSMVVDHAEAGTWSTTDFGHRTVRVGTEAMLDQSQRPGRPYVYDVGDVRFVVTTGDEAWAAEAFARLRPDPVTENAALLVSLPDAWRPGFSPTVDEETTASAHDAGILTAAHDGSKLDGRYIPTLEIYYTHTQPDTALADSLDGWAADYPDEPWAGRTLRSIDRVGLPSGEALRLELSGEAGEPPFTVAEIRYLVVSPEGVFDLLFSAAESDLPDHEATFDEMARSFLSGLDQDGALARLGRGELTRTEYEMLAGGYTVVPEPPAPGVPVGNSGPIVLGGRIEVPADGFALEVPEGWHAMDLTHAHVVEVMEGFNETTRNLREGRLVPENPLKRGAFAVFGTALGGFTMGVAEDLADDGSTDTFDLLAFAPWDGAGGPNECVVYGWDGWGTPLRDEAAETAQALRDADYEVALDFIELPAGEAAHITAASEQREISIFTLQRNDRFYYLECGHRDRHDRQWQEMAESFDFLPLEP